MTTSPLAIEDMLRDALDRLHHQEQRTAALEAVLTQTPTLRVA